MLLDGKDSTPDIKDNEGRTPLSWAAEFGYMGMVEMLLEQGNVTPNTPDKGGRTALSRAQCSEPSSPSVLGVGPDGPPAVVRLFSTPWTDYGKFGWDRTPYGAL